MVSRPFFELLRDGVPIKWTREFESLFQDIKDRISAETILALPNPKRHNHIHVDSLSFGTRSIPVQEFPSGKRIVWFNSRTFTKYEQKTSTLHRQICETLIRSKNLWAFHQCFSKTNQNFLWSKPLLYLWAAKRRLYEIKIIQLTNLQIIRTHGRRLISSDLLSWKVSLKDLNGHQTAREEIPRDIRFFK